MQQTLELTTGEILLIYRNRKGWTLAELAEQSGIPESTLSRYERDVKGGRMIE